MAKKIYLYDALGYDFYACEHEGLDSEGKPRLTIMTPGRPVVNFLEHIKANGDDPRDYFLLCEEGQRAESKFVVEMMGLILLNTLDPLPRMAERLEEMQKYGIKYDRELLKVNFRIYDFNDEISKNNKYRIIFNVGDHRGLGDSYKFKDIDELIDKLSGFFCFIEQQVQIPLKKCLVVKDHVKKQVSSRCADLFDEIEIY